jgi:hypothetical protein
MGDAAAAVLEQAVALNPNKRRCLMIHGSAAALVLAAVCLAVVVLCTSRVLFRA